MDELDLVRELLPPQPAPRPEAVAAARARLTTHHGSIARHADRRASRRFRPSQATSHRWMAGVAASAALAGLVTGLLVVGGRPGHPAAGPASPSRTKSALRQPRHAIAIPHATARTVLLLAASRVPKTQALTTGRYWRVRTLSTRVVPAGTREHPYDLLERWTYDQWFARAANGRDWTISRAAGAAPLTQADKAAWRAAGSPARWRRTLAGPDEYMTMTPGPASVTSQLGHGTVGYVEGDLPGLTAAQFRAIPDTAARLGAYLRRVARRLPSVQDPGGGGATETELVWDEAVDLLQDPVSPAVRAAAFRVMADLPGVRLLGQTRDPLGRYGYELQAGPSEIRGDVFVDPLTGTLLATLIELPVHSGPGIFTARCRTADGSKAIEMLAPSLYQTAISRSCAILVPPLYGRPYNGPLSGLTSYVVAGWTNASPPAPAGVGGGHG